MKFDKFKEIFIDLTEYTIPFGEESYIVDKLKEYVPNIKQDNIGNCFIEIGESETLFTTHMDTYSKKIKKVNHKVEGDWIGTDGKTILGGDNKNGMTILLYMISKNIPGTYYFFVGEEPIISGGLYGSRNALHENPSFFKKFKRAIAFDRKQKGSIVIRQMAVKCCSDEFSEFLISEFGENGMEFHKDPNAYYTDTATFLDVIPEITNISAGGWGEHTLEEKTLISYTYEVAVSASKIRWEDSPVVRTPGLVPLNNDIKKLNDKITEKTFNSVDRIMDMYGYRCLNPNEVYPGSKILFSHWHKDSEIILVFNKNEIFDKNDNRIGDLKEFKEMFGVKFEHMVDINDFINELIDYMGDDDEISFDDVNELLLKYDTNIDEFMDYIERNESINDYIKIKGNKFVLNF